MADLAPAGPDRTHRTILIAAAIAATALWTTLATAQLHPAAADVVKVLAGFTTGVALVLPWCRRAAHRSVQAVAEVADLQLDAARQSASSHAARWRAIVDTATEGIVTIDERGTIEEVNGAAERLFGFGSGELTGKNVRVLMPSPHQEMHDEYLRAYLKTGERRIIGIGREVMGRHRNGTEFPIDLSVGEGTSQGQRFFAAVIRDLTERKEMQMKLAQTERLAAVGELAAGIAHEVNNPLGSILIYAHLLCEDLAGDAERRADAELILREANRCRAIVGGLLDFARQSKVERAPVDLRELAEEAARNVAVQVDDPRLEVRVEAPAALPPAQVDRDQLLQVLLNLVRNAADAMPAGGTVTLRLGHAAERGEHVIEVSDTGPGIPAEHMDRLFSPFFTTKPVGRGTGLGLPICYGIVKMHRGSISARNRAPERGAAFEVRLPSAPAVAGAASEDLPCPPRS